MIKNNKQATTVFGKMQLFAGKENNFMERHISRGYLVPIEDISSISESITEDMIHKVHEESKKGNDLCKKWERYSGTEMVDTIQCHWFLFIVN